MSHTSVLQSIRQSEASDQPPQKTQPDRPKQALVRRCLQQLQSIARELYDSELFREATDLFRYLTVVEPSNPSHWYWLGRSHFSLGDPLGAARVFELGGRLSHSEHFRLLAAESWTIAGYPEHARAILEQQEGVAA